MVLIKKMSYKFVSETYILIPVTDSVKHNPIHTPVLTNIFYPTSLRLIMKNEHPIYFFSNYKYKEDRNIQSKKYTNCILSELLKIFLNELTEM